MSMTVKQPAKRLVFEVWNDAQAVAAAKAAREFDGETIIRWVGQPSASKWPLGEGHSIVLTEADVMRIGSRADNGQGVGPNELHQREIDRIRGVLVSLPDGELRNELYAAQQALSWALDPGGIMAPYTMIIDNGVEQEDYSALRRLPRSDARQDHHADWVA